MSIHFSDQQPPSWITKILKWRAGSAQLEDLQGDLEEQYFENLELVGRRRANWKYFKEVMALCFSYALRKRKKEAAYADFYADNSWAMFQNYFKIAFRSFMKHKMFTIINIVGLALGMTICLLALSLWVSIVESDEFHEKKERVFQVNTFVKDVNLSRLYGSTYPALGDYLENEYPFVEQALTIHSGFRPEVKHQGNLLDFHGYFTDSEFFDVFSFQLTAGDPHTALRDPFTVVITQKVAEKLFRNANPVGKILETDLGDFTITGVMPDLKETHLYFQMLTSTATYDKLYGEMPLAKSWQEFKNHYLYVLLTSATEEDKLQTALAHATEKAVSFNEQKEIVFSAVALDEAVPRWDISNAIGIGWDYPSMLFFMFIGLLILLPAVFNYTNLSIARAMKRAKEIGVRKVVGAQKRQIKMQFIVETILITFFALLGAMLLLIPVQNELFKMIISAEVLDRSISWSVLLVFIVFALMIGIFAGIFPAVYFSKLNPVHTLKGSLGAGGVSVSGIKKGLFVFQFGLSLFFIIGVATMIRQYQYVFNHKHGFDTDQILVIPFLEQDKALAVEQLSKHSAVQWLTASSHLPGLPSSNVMDVLPNGVDTLTVMQVEVWDDFIQNMSMKWHSGGAEQLPLSNSTEKFVVVNEQYFKSARVFGANPDSMQIRLADGSHAQIVGVLEDMHFEPLNDAVRPMIFSYGLENCHFLLMNMRSNDIQNTVAELESVWRSINNDVVFEPVFLDDEIQKAYKFLTVQIKIFSFLGALAIIIACLGLLGMVAFTTENRTKEIAIRKIMGASMTDIYVLLTKDFVKLIGLSALFAVPLAYVFYEHMFLYMLIRYGLGLGVMEVLASVVFLFAIGFCFIYWQTSKVAQTNPANNLRYE